MAAGTRRPTRFAAPSRTSRPAESWPHSWVSRMRACNGDRAPAGARALASVRPRRSRADRARCCRIGQRHRRVPGPAVALATKAPATSPAPPRRWPRARRPRGRGPGPGMVDGSGLAARDRLSPADARRRPAAGRFRLEPPGAARHRHRTARRRLERHARRPLLRAVRRWRRRGTVRAKTGTLTGVSRSPASCTTADGRLLAFAFVADEVAPATGRPRRPRRLWTGWPAPRALRLSIRRAQDRPVGSIR